jgi:hypothetical protein
MADRTDPLQYTRKERAPEFDIAADRADWGIWRLKWAAFLDSSGVDRLSEGDGDAASKLARNAAIQKHKYSALIQAFSTATLRTVRSLPLAAGDRENADRIIDALTASISQSKGSRVYRHEMRTRTRGEESVESFSVALQDLALQCNFKDCCLDEALADAFISNINDAEITEKLMQTPPATTFAALVEMARAMEGARSFSRAVQLPAAAAARFQAAPRPTGPSPTCGYCGGQRHPSIDQCPARGKTCNRCGKLNHYDKVCRSSPRGGGNNSRTGNRARRAATVQPDTGDDWDPECSPTVNSATTLSCTAPAEAKAAFTHVDGRPDPMRRLQTLPVRVKCTKVPALRATLPFLPDSGSNVSAINPKHMAEMKLLARQLGCRDKPPAAPRMADNSRSMRCLGVFRGTFQFGSATFDEDVYVYDGLHQPLLSRWACFGLGILRSEVLEPTSF